MNTLPAGSTPERGNTMLVCLSAREPTPMGGSRRPRASGRACRCVGVVKCKVVIREMGWPQSSPGSTHRDQRGTVRKRNACRFPVGMSHWRICTPFQHPSLRDQVSRCLIISRRAGTLAGKREGTTCGSEKHPWSWPAPYKPGSIGQRTPPHVYCVMRFTMVVYLHKQ